MTVYVDQLMHYNTSPLGARQWCHMMADTEEELHALAQRIGLHRAWFQHKESEPWFDHYDLVASKRALAVKHGAVEVDARDLVMMLVEQKG